MKELFLTFFRLGFIAFGGPVAHLALIEQEYINKSPYISKEEFLNFIGAVSLIPGPNSTQVVLLCGYQRFGVLGMLLSGFAFIFPATVLTLILAFFYAQGQNFPLIFSALKFLPLGMIPIIIFSLIQFTKKTAKNSTQVFLLIFAFLFYFITKQELISIITTSILGIFLYFIPHIKNKFFTSPLFFIFIRFFIIGGTLFGGGFNLIAYVQQFFSSQLSHTQILDAIAMGQFTPGPILTTASFMGYQLHGLTGGLIATLGIFIPSMILIPFVFQFLNRPKNPLVQMFFDSANSGAVGVMNALILSLVAQSQHLIQGLPLIILASLLCYFKKNNILIVLSSIVYGLIFSHFIQG